MKKYIFMFCLLLLLASLLLFHITKERPFDSNYEKNTIGNHTNNIINRGKVALQGDWIYYYNANFDFIYPGGLYRIKKDGSNLSLMDTGVIDSINVVGDWVYYVKNSTVGKITYSSLYKIKLDGTSKQKIRDNATYIHVIGDKIYYSVNVEVLGEIDEIELNFSTSEIGNIYQCDLDGKNCNKIVDRKNGGFLHILNNYIYYNDGFQFYRINILNKKTEYLTDIDKFVMVSEDAIYYFCDNEYTIFKYDIDNQTTSKIAENIERVNYMIVINDKLYYRNGIGNSLQIIDLYTLETKEVFVSGDIYSFNNEAYLFYDKNLKKLKI